MSLKALGNKVSGYTGLETFKEKQRIGRPLITLSSDEVTALCPVTNQPDWYKVEVSYIPDTQEPKYIESKSFKLFLHSLRNKGEFCEDLSQTILKEVLEATQALYINISITQKPRGGVSIIASATYTKE